MLVRDDVSVLDEEFWKWLTKCEIRADPASVALLSSMGVAHLQNVYEKPVPSKQACTDCTEWYVCVNCTVSPNIIRCKIKFKINQTGGGKLSLGERCVFPSLGRGTTVKLVEEYKSDGLFNKKN